jgi:hypothetical protein
MPIKNEKTAAKKEKTQEQTIIEQYFKGNEGLLKMMRRLFYGLAVTDAERKIIKDTFKDPVLFKIISNRFLPDYRTIDDDVPIGGSSDVWLGVEEMCFGKHEDTIKQAIEYKYLSIKMTQQALALLQNPNGKQINLEYIPSMYPNDPQAINLLGRNIYMRHIDKQLTFLYVVANADNINIEDVKKRLEMNSSK